jgi:diguanylate cyclase (GGDEF)-like protein/PAS domain S-box-containing protein
VEAAEAGHGEPAQDTVVTSLLVQNPGALVAAIDQDGLFVPMPESVPLDGQRIAVARSALDLVAPASRPSVITAWAAVKEEGYGRVSVALVGASEPNALMYFVDVRATYGVFLGIVVIGPAGGGSLAEVADIAPPPPRLARTRKNELAILTYADEDVTAMLGWDATDLVGQSSLGLIHPDDHERAIDLWMECLSHPGGTCRSRLRHLHRDGRWIWLEFSNHNLLDDPVAGYVDCQMLDISEEMEAQEMVRASEQLLRRLSGALPVGVAQFDADRNIRYSNQRLHDMVGAGSAVDGPTLLSCMADPDSVTEALTTVCDGDDADMEVFVDRLDGSGRRLCTLALRALTNADGTGAGGIMCLADITDAAQMQAELEQRATFDPLTGCVNRATIIAMLSSLLESEPRSSARSDAGMGIAFVDLDDFKAVNDQFGHPTGDMFLSAVAARLREVVRAGDCVGRLGGDEFLIISHDVNTNEEAHALGERILAAIRVPLTLGSVRVNPTASVGIAWATSQHSVEAEALIARADAAMYTAKHAGDGRPVVAGDDHSASSAAWDGDLIQDRAETIGPLLRESLAREEFEVYFQPVLDLVTGVTLGYEALLRWQRDGRLVSPAEFLPAAETTAIICEIGPWVIDLVCQKAAAARRDDLRWFINLSPPELAAPRTIAAFETALGRYGVAASSMVVEVTEEGLLPENGVAQSTVSDLDRLGVGISLDDFGTGWSSLSSLLSVPVCWLKIDRRFTAEAHTERGAAIVRAIVCLGEGLAAAVVAEGVETAAERATVESLGVRYAQGYLFARPQPFAELGLGLEVVTPVR